MLNTIRRLWDWIGGHTPAVIVACLIVAAGTWGFIALADEVVEGGTHRFDVWALKALRQPDDLSTPIGPPWAQEAGRDLTALGGLTVLFGVTAMVAGYLLLARQRAAMLLVLVATGTGLAASLLLKGFFERPRPTVVPHLSIVQSSSFPSAHSMLSAVVYLTLGAMLTRFVPRPSLKAYCFGWAVLLTVLVGLSRVYLGVHYPTDVLAGWTAGLVWAMLCWLAARWLQRRGKVEGGQAGDPSMAARPLVQPAPQSTID